MLNVAVSTTASESFVIEGGRPLSGSVRAAGNKMRRSRSWPHVS